LGVGALPISFIEPLFDEGSRLKAEKRNRADFGDRPLLEVEPPFRLSE
jgi:hypothetical protein